MMVNWSGTSHHSGSSAEASLWRNIGWALGARGRKGEEELAWNLGMGRSIPIRSLKSTVGHE